MRKRRILCCERHWACPVLMPADRPEIKAGQKVSEPGLSIDDGSGGNDIGFSAGQKDQLMKTYVWRRGKHYFKSMPPKTESLITLVQN